MQNLNEYKYIQRGYTKALSQLEQILSSSQTINSFLIKKKDILNFIRLMIKYRYFLFEGKDFIIVTKPNKKGKLELIDLRFD